MSALNPATRLINEEYIVPDQKSGQSSRTEPTFFYGYVVVSVACVIMVVTWGTYYSFGIFFKPILTEFGWTRAMTAGAFSLATIIQGVVAIPVGRLTDRFGPRMLLTLCGFLSGLGYILMSQINSIWQLYLFYGVMVGIGMGGPFVSLVSTIARWFAMRRGLMTGIVVAGIGLGAIVVPPIANWLILHYDWRIAYLVLGSTVLVLVMSATQFLKRDPAKIGQMPYGQEQIAENQSETEAGAVSFQKAIRTKQLWMVCAMFLCFGFSLFTIMVHIAPHATDLGFSTASAANILAIIGISSIVGKVGMGHVADRIGSRPGWTIGFITMAIAMFWLVATREIWMLYTFAVIFGFAYGGCVSVESPLVAELFGLSSHGIILGLGSFFFTIGAAIGPLQAGYIFDVSSSYQIAFLVCGVVVILGLVLTSFLGPISNKQIGD